MQTTFRILTQSLQIQNMFSTNTCRDLYKTLNKKASEIHQLCRLHIVFFLLPVFHGKDIYIYLFHQQKRICSAGVKFSYFIHILDGTWSLPSNTLFITLVRIQDKRKILQRRTNLKAYLICCGEMIYMHPK